MLTADIELMKQWVRWLESLPYGKLRIEFRKVNTRFLPYNPSHREMISQILARLFIRGDPDQTGYFISGFWKSRYGVLHLERPPPEGKEAFRIGEEAGRA